MGRPIKNKYINPYGAGAHRPGIGGEAVTVTSGNASPTFSSRGTGYYAANVSATVSAPELTDGTTATIGTVYLFANGAVKGLQVTNAGAGYTAAPTVTFFGANSGTASATVAIDVATTSANSILANCYFTGGSPTLTADILKARGARRFVCKTGSTTETLKLVATDTPGFGQMSITATFADASTFPIAKITNRKVWSSTGQSYKWTLATGTAANVSATDITVVVSSL